MTSTSLLLLGVTAALWLLLPLIAVFDGRETNRRAWSALIGLGALALLGAAVLVPKTQEIAFALARPFSLGTIPVAFRLDMPAAWFLAVIALVSGPMAFY